MIPEAEIKALVMTTGEALDLVGEGKLADGYTLLLAGLRRAEAAKEAGETWADALMQRYRRAIYKYTIGYGVSVE